VIVTINLLLSTEKDKATEIYCATYLGQTAEVLKAMFRNPLR